LVLAHAEHYKVTVTVCPATQVQEMLCEGEKMRRILLVLLTLLATASSAETVAVKAGAIIDPVTGSEARDQIVVVENGIIRAVGPGLSIPNGARVVDLSSEWLVPGLMDAHTHLTLPQDSTSLTESTAQRALRGLHNAQAVLAAGFTTVRDVGFDGEYAMLDVRRAVERGFFDGPTIVSSGKIIAPFGGESAGIPPEHASLLDYEYINADTPDDIRRAVRRNLYYGAGVIKLIGEAIRVHYSVEEIRAAVDEAHKAGVPVAVHAYGGSAAQAAIDAGVDSIEHGFELTDAQLTQMKAKGIFLVGTDFPSAHLDAMGTYGGTFPESAVLTPRIIDRLKRAHRIGVRMTFGSDTVIDLPGRTRAELMLDYLAVWRSAGIGPADILRAMTSDAAELLRVGHQRGRISPGLAADIVAMPADPLKDIEALRKIDFVLKGGKSIHTR
jgi:imidazolonepropionase-like amidohydrolase